MAKLIVNDKMYVFNPNFASKSDLVQALKLSVGTECVIQHVAQDNLLDEKFIVEEWMLGTRPASWQFQVDSLRDNLDSLQRQKQEALFGLHPELAKVISSVAYQKHSSGSREEEIAYTKELVEEFQGINKLLMEGRQ
jgi:hypothetical protein